jgi:hypothetical protein
VTSGGRTPIHALVDRHQSVRAFLDEKKEVSHLTEIDANFRKLLVVGCASYFEQRIIEIIGGLAGKGDQRVAEFVRIKALERQYHTFFEWDKPNANRFFAMFGTEFKKTAMKRVEQTPDLTASIKAFVEIGSKRNECVHKNLALMSMDWTLDEIMQRFESALAFVGFLEEVLGLPVSS